MILQQYKQQLDQQGVLLSYYGPMKQNLVENFGSLLRQQLAYHEERSSSLLPKLSKKKCQIIFHVFIEQAQNIAKYSAEYTFSEYTADKVESDFRNGIFIIGKNEQYYYIECCNLVSISRGKNIAKQLAALNLLNADELKKLYRERRHLKTPEGSKGAGLGFIDIIRQTAKMEYKLDSIDNNLSLFSLKIYI